LLEFHIPSAPIVASRKTEISRCKNFGYDIIAIENTFAKGAEGQELKLRK
jgi:hypothetical protein